MKNVLLWRRIDLRAFSVPSKKVSRAFTYSQQRKQEPYLLSVWCLAPRKRATLIRRKLKTRHVLPFFSFSSHLTVAFRHKATRSSYLPLSPCPHILHTLFSHNFALAIYPLLNPHSPSGYCFFSPFKSTLSSPSSHSTLTFPLLDSNTFLLHSPKDNLTDPVPLPRKHCISFPCFKCFSVTEK